MAADPPPGSPTHGRGRPWCLGRSGAFPSAVNGGCDVKPQGEAGGRAAYWARGDEYSVLLDPSRPEVARLIVVMVQARHGRSSLMVALHEPTSEACKPTCSPIRVRPGAS